MTIAQKLELDPIKKMLNALEDENHKLEIKINELNFLNRLSYSLSTTLDLDEIINIVALEINNLISYDIFSILLSHPLQSGNKKGVIKIMSDNHVLSGNIIGKIKTELVQEYNLINKDKMTVESFLLEIKNFFLSTSGERRSGSVVQKDYYLKKESGIRSDLCSRVSLPLNVFGINLGIIYLARLNTPVFDASDNKLLSTVANQTALAIRNALEHKKLEELAVTDGLTNIFNHRTFMQILEREYKRAMRYNKDLSLVIFDLDHFKKINDTKGHQRGDQVLKELADVVKNILRETDVLARYGGEEFALILPDTDQRKGAILAERIRALLENHQYNGHPGEIPLRVTVSMGITSCPNPEIRDKKDMIGFADKALYLAKKGGRNMLCSANFVDYSRIFYPAKYMREEATANAFMS